METLYHTIVGAAILAVSPLILLRMAFSPGFRREVFDRHRGGRSLGPFSDCLWVHASSAGEVRAAKILIGALRKNGEPRPIVLSTFTRTGFDLAIKENIDNVFRLPFDFPVWLKPLFNKLNPSLLVLIEAELWPSLLRQCKRRKIPVLLINGRMSEKSVSRYGKIKPFFQWLADGVSTFSMRAKIDADRVLALGIAPEKVIVTGNIKFDAHTGETANPPGKPCSSAKPLVVFGSTRPGDEAPIMEAILRLRKDLPDIHCAIAPRHLERRQEIESLMREYELDFVLHSQLQQSVPGLKGSLILVDTMGELNHYYSQATVAFVGGGFNPRFGGHNILEPAAYGIPVIYGKFMNNFEEEARLLKESGGGIQLNDPGELYPALHRLLTQPEERDERGRSARETVQANRGSLQRNIDLIKQCRPETGN